MQWNYAGWYVMAFIQYAMQIIMSFLMITAMSIMLPRANVAALRIDEVLKTEVSVQIRKIRSSSRKCERQLNSIM